MNAAKVFGLKTSFAIAVLAMAGMGVFSYVSYNKSLNLSGWVHHTSEVLIELRTLRKNISESESNERGFVISGNVKFLPLYETSEEQSRKSLKRIQELVSDNQLQA